MKNVKNNFIVRCILLLAVISIGVVGMYYMLVDKKFKQSSEEAYPKSTYEILACKDIEGTYPSTPYEVLKLYNKYLKYIYNTELKDEQFETLVDKVRCMWSKEWLELNERSAHISSFKTEVKKFREEGKVMSNYLVNSSETEKTFVTPDNVEGKTLISSYLYSQKKQTSKVYMMFYFLKEEDRWKILYYEVVDESGNKIEVKSDNAEEKSNE